MVEYSKLNVQLSDTQLKKLEAAVKDKTGTTLRMSFKMFNEKDLAVCYYHVTYEFQSESTLYSLPECQGTPC